MWLEKAHIDELGLPVFLVCPLLGLVILGGQQVRGARI